MLTPFAPEDLEKFTPSQDAEPAMKCEFLPALLKVLAAQDLCFTSRTSAGDTLCVMAAVPKEPGVCEVALLSSREQKRWPFTLLTDMRWGLQMMSHRFEKVEAVAEDSEFSARWLAMLGFHHTPGDARMSPVSGRRSLVWRLGHGC